MTCCRFVIACLLAVTPAALGHETDQFAVPVGREMAEMGPYLSRRVADRIDKAVAVLNARIDRAERQRASTRVTVTRRGGNRPGSAQVKHHDPLAELAKCHSPDGVAAAVNSALGAALTVIETLELDLGSQAVREQYPDKITSYQAMTKLGSVYTRAYLPIDPRRIPALFHGSTYKTFGVYQGTDKLGHFVDLGHHYYRAYRRAVERGDSEEKAMAFAVDIGRKGVFSEGGLLGSVMVGSYSNADLVADYTGCLFYRNLTEPVVFKGRLYEPILTRDGLHWRWNDAADRDTFFERCISDHLNEALNPSLYDPLLRGAVRRFVLEHHDELLTWYADKYAGHEPGKYFTDLARVLSTYYGQDYGHSGRFEDLIHLGNSFPPQD